MISSVLVVCIGNVCRSPVGERLLAQACPNIKIESAGINAHVGQEASKPSAKVAEFNGVSVEGHKARQFTDELARQFDLILVMEKVHVKKVEALAPDSGSKTMLFGKWIGQLDIADPYQLSHEFHVDVFEKIKRASDGWIAMLGTG